MSSLSDGEKNVIKTFCKSSSIPTILINDNLICEYSNDESFYPVGIHFASVQELDVKLEKDKNVKTMVKIKDKFYCAVITPVTDEFYICQMFDPDSIFEMAQYSEVNDEIRSIFSPNGMYLEEIEDNIKRLVLRDEVKENYKLDTDLLLLAAKIATAKGRYEDVMTYFDIAFSKNNNKELLSLYAYVKWCVDKCNSILANIGRCLELNCNDRELLVSADIKFAIFSFIDLFQSILLYSAKDVNPFISIQKGKGFVEFMVTCRGLIYVPKGGEDDFIGENVNRNITMVRRFAKRSNAEFSFINERDNVIGFKILFPEVTADKTDSLLFEETEIVDFDNAYSNYIEYKMQDVIKAYKLQRGK